MKKENKIKKNFILNTIGVTINSFTSLIYMIIVTRINGISEAGVFTYAFSIALLIETIGLYSSRVFQVTESNKNISDSDYIYTHFFTAFLMIVVGVLFCVVNKYLISKFAIFMFIILFRAFESIEESLYAVIQKNDDLYKVGISFVIKSLLSVLLLLIIDLITHKIIFAALSLFISQIITIIIYDLPCLKKYKFSMKKFNRNNVIYILKSGFFTFSFLILSQILLNEPKIAIDNHLSSSSQTIYGIIAMPTTVMVLLGQYLIHPILTKLTSLVKEKKYDEFNKIVFKVILILFLLGIVIDIIAYFIGIPILEILYGTNLKKYKIGLVIILFASIIYGIVNIMFNSLIVIRKTFGQSIIFLTVDFLGIFLGNYFIPKYKVYGAVYSYLSLMIVLLILYIIYYIISLNKLKSKKEKKI